MFLKGEENGNRWRNNTQLCPFGFWTHGKSPPPCWWKFCNFSKAKSLLSYECAFVLEKKQNKKTISSFGHVWIILSTRSVFALLSRSLSPFVMQRVLFSFHVTSRWTIIRFLVLPEACLLWRLAWYTLLKGVGVGPDRPAGRASATSAFWELRTSLSA